MWGSIKKLNLSPYIVQRNKIKFHATSSTKFPPYRKKKTAQSKLYYNLSNRCVHAA